MSLLGATKRISGLKLRSAVCSCSESEEEHASPCCHRTGASSSLPQCHGLETSWFVATRCMKVGQELSHELCKGGMSTFGSGRNNGK